MSWDCLAGLAFDHSLHFVMWSLVNDRDRYRVSDIGDIGKVEDICLLVFAADSIQYVICILLPGTNEQASCHYAKLPVHGMQNCGERFCGCKCGVGGKCCRSVCVYNTIHSLISCAIENKKHCASKQACIKTT